MYMCEFMWIHEVGRGAGELKKEMFLGKVGRC